MTGWNLKGTYCNRCKCPDTLRSKRRGYFELRILERTSFRAFRCNFCGHRFYARVAHPRRHAIVQGELRRHA